MESISVQELLQATGGKLLGNVDIEHTWITGVQSDNRVVKDGEVFFAFVGEKADGHRFVLAALQAGAAGAVVSREPQELPSGKFCILVPDTIRALEDLAAWYRDRFDMPVVGITGSVGKTTTKDMIASVLSEKYQTLKTEGNFNNNIGLPKTILNLSKETQMAVIEMGMNHKGEIDDLVHIAKPQTVTITNIGDAHIGNLGSKENIFKAKCEIFGGLAEGGLAVLNGDDEFLVKLREDPEKQAKFRFTFVGEGKDCEWRAENINEDGQESMRFTAVTPVGTFPVTVPALGHHMIYPALTAAAIGAHYGLSVEEIQAGIAHYVPTKMRMETLHLPGRVTLYNDTYNANPQSMEAGLLTLSRTQAARRIAVLGDMGELGEAEERLHREVGRYAAGLSLDALVTVGTASEKLAEEAVQCGMEREKVLCCRDKEQAKEVLRKLSGPETAWLVKASRVMALEELAKFVQGLAENGTASADEKNRN